MRRFPARRPVIAFGPTAAALTVAAALAGPVAAQTTACDRLYAAIQAADGSGGGGERWAQAAARQQAELDRTQSYADRLGCGRGLFGLGDPAGCDGLNDRMGRMRANLATLQDRAGRGRTGDRAALVARYNSQCVGIGGAGTTDAFGPDGRGTLPDDGAIDPRQDPYDPDNGMAPAEGEPAPAGTGRPRGQAICVRSCDGGWFPLGATATDDGLPGLEELCQASCPNTEAHLYTRPREGALDDATAADGAPYTALPAAFKFQKELVPACTCKPPNQSWSEALAKAEQLLGDRDTRDIVVTAALSDQMAKPGAVPAAGGKPAGKPSGKAARKGAAPAAPTPAADSAGDLAAAAARDGQKGMQAPTASDAASGIGGPAKAERLVREGEGERVTLPGPDGLKRTLRLIVP